MCFCLTPSTGSGAAIYLLLFVAHELLPGQGHILEVKNWRKIQTYIFTVSQDIKNLILTVLELLGLQMFFQYWLH